MFPGKKVVCYDAKQFRVGKFGEKDCKEVLQNAEETTKVTQCD